jgi:hypothetical protein
VKHGVRFLPEVATSFPLLRFLDNQSVLKGYAFLAWRVATS